MEDRQETQCREIGEYASEQAKTIEKPGGEQRAMASWKKGGRGSSLMVPWLGFATFTAVTQVQSLVGEMRSQQPHSVDNNNKKKCKKGVGWQCQVLQEVI